MRSSAGTLEPGAEVGGRYRIVRPLGAGGMARVWLADDLEQRMQVAFKEMLVLPEGTAAERAESVLLFRREYFAMKKLQHPGTVRVFDCGVMETGDRYITMEVVSGRDLAELIASPLPTGEVYRVLSRLAQILGFVHSRLFVHCDVKAENIRITDSGDVKLMDFGIMHPLGVRAPDKVWGTPVYMAPEWRDRGVIDGRSDLFSLGVLGFFLLTGAMPFSTEVMTQPLRGGAPPPAPRPQLAEIDPALSAIILRLLEPAPADRFQTAAAMVAALHAASGAPLADEPLAARASYLYLPGVVGREQETAALAARLAAARRGSSRALFIGAPAGVGKSRLLAELELDARNFDVPFALGQCRAEGLAARAPIEQALRALIPATPAEILDPLRPVLDRLLPGLASAPRSSYRDMNEEKAAVFEALGCWLSELAVRRPFVLCLEDLHWADHTTLEVLNLIIRVLDDTRGLVVVTFRSDELDRLSPGFQAVDDGVADHLELPPLSERSLAALVGIALEGFGGGEALARRLYGATRGNVFFATECLRLLIEEGALTRRLGTWTADPDHMQRPLPASIQQVVLARLSTLSERQIAFFRRLAPAGRVLDIPLIHAIADASPQEMFQMLDEGVERQFLQYVEGKYIFTHATVHEAIYQSMPAAMQRSCHGRIAEHLDQVSDGHAEAARTIGYHFARSDTPIRAIDPLETAAAYALDTEALLDVFDLLEQVVELLQLYPEVPHRDRRLIAAWGTLIEVSFHSNTPACWRYAQKLFGWWEKLVDFTRGRDEVYEALERAHAAPPEERGALLSELFREIPIAAATGPREVFQKRAEYQSLQSISLAITGRTAELAAALARSVQEHPPGSPYRAATRVALGGLTAHTGRFRGLVDDMREQVHTLRELSSAVAGCPRRLEWVLGMGAYFINVNLALMGLPLDDGATAEAFALAERRGLAEVRIYHVFAQVVRASFIGDATAFTGPFAEMNELIRKLGKPRLPQRNLVIYTPVYYLERGELQLARAVIERGERFMKLLPDDRWLALYVEVYRACLDVERFVAITASGAAPDEGAAADPAPPSPGAASPDAAAIDAALARAIERTSAADFRMETFALVYRARFERARGDVAAARAAAQAALARATDPVRANPFDELLARRELASASDDRVAHAELTQAAALAEATGNVLQSGIVELALAALAAAADPAGALGHLETAQARFTAARAHHWLKRAGDHRNPSGRTRPRPRSPTL